ncbi:MAG: phospho-N-acetylmuramoyl-pentapeptide-transferase [Coriobacteriales bacterium]|nr:phospho-N-acetylmuramoyl-pentapeptide-transferase [Coriobacteriales bacterium]
MTAALNLVPTPAVFWAVVLSAAITLVAMPFFIRFMKKEKVGAHVHEDGPHTHSGKEGTPMMGGAVMIAAVVVTSLVLAPGTPSVICAVIATIVTCLIGATDDLESVTHGESLGLTPGQKMACLIAVSVVFCLAAVNWVGIAPVVRLSGGIAIDLGVLTTTIGGFRIPWLYVLFVFLLMAGLSNAVNLTDGLDGLAGGTVLGVMLAMVSVCLAVGDPGLAVFAAAIVGACGGFLWFNCNPAAIFMGDTGSLALGAAFAALAILTKTEATSLVMGGLFIAEAVSDIIQVAHYKATGRRVFLMAPIHHHFEKKGWPEQKVVVRFWLVSAAFATLGFALFLTL